MRAGQAGGRLAGRRGLLRRRQLVEPLHHLDAGGVDVPEPASSAGQERPARASLLAQVGRPEGELTELVCCDRWRLAPEATTEPGQGARLLSLGELEAIRDRLVTRVGEGREEVSIRTQAQDAGRRLREAMLLEPGRHRWVRVTNKEIGEPGCLSWHVRPRLGPLGMLMNWWRVMVSSGCP